jgi:uncharacterized protein Yka (UPF0111/DUF47 family)
MKLRLFPRQEDAYFGLFQAAADNIAAAATVLLELLTDLVDPETKAKQLADLEHEGDRITRTILTRLPRPSSPAWTATTSSSWPNGSTT